MQDGSEEVAIHPFVFTFAALAIFLTSEARVPEVVLKIGIQNSLV